MNSTATPHPGYEYIVVGSGAGGGTLAARLAEGGHKVLLLEAGGDPCGAPVATDPLPSNAGIPEDYEVPLFHPNASENDALRWDFFVRHYADDARQARDPKYREEWNGRRVDGVLYPRAGTLGGCTAHNAMFFVYPHEADWNAVAQLTGDASWRAERMHRLFQRLENCRYRAPWRWLARLGFNPTGHGWNGWLALEKAIPLSALKDHKLIDVLLETVRDVLETDHGIVKRLFQLLASQADPNDLASIRANVEGFCVSPLTTRGHQRIGTRERVLETKARHPDRLTVELNALATRVLFDDGERAVGVEYRKGGRLYRAHADPATDDGELRTARASREVILCGGAFNTPQLLMLSGIGSEEQLSRHGIAPRVDLPGVGRNLQDRYEVAVVNEMNFPCWEVLQGARFARGDPQFEEWSQTRNGVYATNGVLLALTARSSTKQALPDLFHFAMLGRFEGYFPGYSRLIPRHLNYLTWAILKAHTNNRAGEVTLRSADPRDPPHVNFRYFEEGSDSADEDLEAVVAGIKIVRGVTAPLRKRGYIAAEKVPGPDVRSDDELRAFVRDNAWGHHASCTCAIGPREQGGVLTSEFRVHGTQGLRVVDASVFPRIPGFFIASAIYIIAEKAAEVIIADAAA